MKKVSLIAALTFALAAAGHARAATMYFELHASNEFPFLANPLNVKVQHSWGEAWSWTYAFNATQSWMSGIGRCTAWTGVSSCSYAYRSTKSGWTVSNSATPSDVIYAFDRHIPGTYLVNGVCHQATNRALQHYTPMKRVVDYGLMGAGTSQSIFGTCGKHGPWGFGISCPK